MGRKNRSGQCLVLAIGLFLFIGFNTAHADLLFDRGLPTANLNNAANPNRSNFAVLSEAYEVPNPPSYKIFGDDFIIKGPGNYHIEIARVWVVSGSTEPTGLKLIIGKEGGSLEILSSTFTVSKAYYVGGERYQRFSTGIFVDFYQIDFVVNREVEGGKKYHFFVDGPLFPTVNVYTSVPLHESNAASSGSAQEGADNYLLRLTLNNGVPGTIEVLDNPAPNFGRPLDANIQLFGSQVPNVSSLSGPYLLLLLD